METNARHLLVGSFIVIVLLGFLGFAMWISRFGFDEDVHRYDIYFENTVAGLGEGGDVTYRGIKVGRVEDLAIDPDNPLRVRTTVRVRGNPIRQGDRATLQLQGITGVTYINIEGATQESPPLEATADEARPIIPSAPSPFEEMLQDAPDIFSKINLVLDRVGGLFDDGNRARFAGILVETEKAMRGLTEREAQVGELLEIVLDSREDITASMASMRRSAAGFEALAGESRATVQAAHAALESLDDVVEEDLRLTLDEYRATAVSLRQSMTTLERMIVENEEAIDRFARQGLPEFQALAADTRRLVNRLYVLTEKIEARGAGALLVPQPTEFEVPE